MPHLFQGGRTAGAALFLAGSAVGAALSSGGEGGVPGVPDLFQGGHTTGAALFLEGVPRVPQIFSIRIWCLPNFCFSFFKTYMNGFHTLREGMLSN